MLQHISERLYDESNRRRGSCATLIFQRCYRIPDAVGMNISVATSPACQATISREGTQGRNTYFVGRNKRSALRRMLCLVIWWRKVCIRLIGPADLKRRSIMRGERMRLR